MSEIEAKRNLLEMLRNFNPGSILHLLAEVIREAEEARLGELDEIDEERVQEAVAALWVFGHGLMAAMPR